MQEFHEKDATCVVALDGIRLPEHRNTFTLGFSHLTAHVASELEMRQAQVLIVAAQKKSVSTIARINSMIAEMCASGGVAVVYGEHQYEPSLHLHHGIKKIVLVGILTPVIREVLITSVSAPQKIEIHAPHCVWDGIDEEELSRIIGELGLIRRVKIIGGTKAPEPVGWDGSRRGSGELVLA